MASSRIQLLMTTLVAACMHACMVVGQHMNSFSTTLASLSNAMCDMLPCPAVPCLLTPCCAMPAWMGHMGSWTATQAWLLVVNCLELS
ncbi:hypothetical protein V8C86DRAFT_2611006 [Haematococcus lacustris]